MHDRRDFQLFRSITRKLYEAGSNIPKNCVSAITISHLFRREVIRLIQLYRILLPRFNAINIDVIYIFLKLEKDTFHLFQFFINRNSSSLFPISIAFYITSPYISKYIYDKSVKFILINLKMKYLKKKKFLWNVDSLYAQIYIYIYTFGYRFNHRDRIPRMDDLLSTDQMFHHGFPVTLKTSTKGKR